MKVKWIVSVIVVAIIIAGISLVRRQDDGSVVKDSSGEVDAASGDELLLPNVVVELPVKTPVVVDEVAELPPPVSVVSPAPVPMPVAPPLAVPKVVDVASDDAAPVADVAIDVKERIAAAIAMAQDASIDLPKRKSAIEALGRKGDKDSVNTLMAIGDEHIYLNREAVKALGLSRDKSVEVTGYLKNKIADGDANIAVAAINSLVMITGADAVAYIDPAFALNYKRHDGHEEIICTSAIKALGDLHVRSAIPVYVRELKRAQDRLWSMEYGGAVVAALAEVGGKVEAKLINEYADSLEESLPEDEMARKSIQAKIDAIREAAKRM